MQAIHAQTVSSTYWCTHMHIDTCKHPQVSRRSSIPPAPTHTSALAMGATCGRRSSLVMVPAKISGDAHPSASDDSVLNRASQASLAGSELFAKRQYAKAIAAFTEAIDEAEEDRGGRRMLCGGA